MNKQADQKRQRLLHDTQDIKVWYKLYKSGTKWIVAGIATATFGLSIMATPAKADTVADDPTTSASIATTAPTPPATTTTDESTVSTNDVATTPSQSADTTSVDSTTEAVPAVPPADQSASVASTSPITSAPVTQQPTAPTDSASADQPAATTKSATTDAVAPAPAQSPTVAAAPTPVAPIDPNSETATSDSAQPATATVGSAPLVAATLAADTTSGVTTTAVNPASVDVTKVGYQNSLDLTNFIISTDIPGVQALGSGTRFYTDGDQLMLIYLNYPINDVPLAQEVFNNKEYLQNLTYEATNTREINGQLTLTNDSIITVHVPAQTITVSIPDGLYKVPYGEWVLYGTDFSPDSVDESGNHPLSGDMNALVSQTTVSSRFPAGPSITANGTNSVTIPAGDYQYSMSGIQVLQLRATTMYGPLTNNDGHHFLFDSSWTMFTVDTIALTPEITVWQNSNPVMTGTGTGVGNTITIKDTTGNAIATTTVGGDGKWSADLTGVDQSTGLYVEESNDLGDQTGVVAATQFETANRIIHYVDEQGNELRSVFTQDLPVQRENTATIDPTSQIVSWVPGTWEPTLPTINYFSAAGNPIITGYYTKDVVAPSAPFSDLDVNNITTPLNTDVLYQKLASWEPSEPGVAPILYPNDPANPGGVLDPSSPEAPALPYVPGKTPVGPDGNSLTPKDPNDPSKGYIPPTPTDPGTATPISYVADTQKGTVTYQDINDAANPAVLGLVDPLSGNSGSTSDYRATDRIAELIAKGYALQDNPYPATGVVFDTDTSKDQDFVITFTHATATITPDKPGVPGDPIDPNNPDGPKWPANSDDVTGLTKVITETITYVNDQGDTVVADYTDTVNFATTATVDLSNGQITIDPNWTVTSKNADGTADTTFDEVNSPLIPGYFADKGTIAAVTGITPDMANINEQVVYRKLGGWTPTDPTLPPIEYVVDPDDPSKLLPTTDPKTPVIPDVPGTTPIGPDGKPLTPIDPNDPGKGYIPPTPADPGASTPIDYVADPQKATVTYQDVNDAAAPKPLGTVDELDGKAGATSPYTTAARIAELVAQGYVLKDDGYPAAGVVFDDDPSVDQAFIVTFTHGTATITPEAPGKPGDPIDANNPDGPKWPAGSDDVSGLKQDVTEVITYIDNTGAEVASSHNDVVSFVTTATVDLTTGTVTIDPNWTVATKNADGTADTTFDAVTSPAVPGYYADKGTIAAVTGITKDTANVVEQVTYNKLGGWTPTDPSLPPIDYVVDPEDPSKLLPTTDPKTPVIPDVPGTTPIGPDGKPLQPVDPNDPGKGYVPPTPIDPGTSTPIDYVTHPQKATVTYQDVSDATPKTLGDVETLEGQSGATSPYTTVARIAELVAHGYVLKDDAYPAAGVVFDNDTNVDQAFVVTFTHGTATITPDQPGKPGEPIDPGNPDGPKWPQGSDDITTLKKDVKQTITYVDNTGAEMAPTYSETISFTRDGTVDLVTGTITPNTTWTAPDSTTFKAVTSPLIDGYFADIATVDEIKDVTAETADPSTQVIYQKLGGWTTPDGQPIPYPNDPDNPGGILDPADPKAPVIPYVPGKTPQGPDGKPLTPKDPNDPTQGYVPPTPGDLSKDTPITYVDNDTGGNPGSGTGTTPGTGGGTGTTPGTGGATGTTPDTGGSTSTPPSTGTTPEATPPADAPIAPEEVGESGTGIAQQPADVPTASGTGNVAQTAAGNDNLGTGALSAPSNAPTVASQGTAETAANANAAHSLPQTDESTSIWARIGLALIGALGLAGLASRRKKEE